MVASAYVPPVSASTGGATCTTKAVCEKRTAAVVGVAAALALATLPMYAPPVHADIINRGLCVSGEGPGCADATEENPLIKELQEKSRINKDKNEMAAKEKYWMEGVS